MSSFLFSKVEHPCMIIPRPFRFGARVLDLACPQVMGILNVTPDSFSDGGELLHNGAVDLDKVLQRAEAMVSAGASILDIGGESTRPGAAAVSAAEELERMAPVFEALAARFDVVLSMDTSTPEVITACAALGAGLINDVRALTLPGSMQAAAASQLPICLMHIKGEPRTMQQSPRYQDVVSEVIAYLHERVTSALDAGVDRGRLLVDPGFGFGKNLEHNLRLLKELQRFKELQLPLLIGLSRKRMLGSLTGRPEQQRGAAGVAAALIAVMKGACIVRTHDVPETVDALKVWHALQKLD